MSCVRAKLIATAVLALVAAACSDGAPTGPSTEGPGPRQTLLPEMTATLSGTVLSASGVPIEGATVRVLDGLSVGTAVTTDAAGQYRFERLPRTNTNFSATAANHVEDRRGVRVDGSATLDFMLEPTPLFTRSGTGNDVFDLPPSITRVRIQGRWNGTGTSTFTVRIAGRTAVNENLRTINYEGVHLAAANGGGVVEVANAANIAWTVTEVR
jgi:hypothetical protein